MLGWGALVWGVSCSCNQDASWDYSHLKSLTGAGGTVFMTADSCCGCQLEASGPHHVDLALWRLASPERVICGREWKEEAAVPSTILFQKSYTVTSATSHSILFITKASLSPAHTRREES